MIMERTNSCRFLQLTWGTEIERLSAQLAVQKRELAEKANVAEATSEQLKDKVDKLQRCVQRKDRDIEDAVEDTKKIWRE